MKITLLLTSLFLENTIRASPTLHNKLRPSDNESEHFTDQCIKNTADRESHMDTIQPQYRSSAWDTLHIKNVEYKSVLDMKSDDEEIHTVSHLTWCTPVNAYDVMREFHKLSENTIMMKKGQRESEAASDKRHQVEQLMIRLSLNLPRLEIFDEVHHEIVRRWNKVMYLLPHSTR